MEWSGYQRYGVGRMSWQSDWRAAFGIFSQNMTYSRGTTSATVSGFVSMAKTEEVSGEFTSTTCRVTIPCSDLQLAGLYPPQEYDRVTFQDGVPRSVSQVLINYVQATPQWARLTVSG